MDPKLTAAAQNGDVKELRNLMAGNPFLLKPAELTGGENPLHIACMAGHLDFVKEILFYNPEFAEELNTDGLSPLHIASTYGYLDIVVELLKFWPHLCSVRGKNGKTALHYAVARGQIQVIDVLIRASLNSIQQASAEGETCFHMAVKHNQVEALQHLTTHVKSLGFTKAMFLLNRGNKQGNTILHLAAMRRQYEVVDHLLLTMKPYLKLNVVNSRGLTALDILVANAGRRETQEELIRAGAKRAANSSSFLHVISDIATRFHYKFNASSETRDAMLVVTVLIIAATFQAMVNPPGGVWQDTVVLGNNNTAYDHPSKVNSTELPHVAGTSIRATLNPLAFKVFLFINTIAFFISCQLSILLIKPPYKLVVSNALLVMIFTYISIAAGVTNGNLLPDWYQWTLLAYVGGAGCILGLLFVCVSMLEILQIIMNNYECSRNVRVDNFDKF